MNNGVISPNMDQYAYRENFIKEPWGIKLHKFINSIKKKIKYELSYDKRMDLFQKKGLKIGKNVHIAADVKIDEHFCHLISIGDNCRIARNVTILSHDGAPGYISGGYGTAGAVEIGENCIIGANSIILPGATIGSNVIVAAGSVVNKSIPSNSCVSGNPARFYDTFDNWLKKYKEGIEKSDYIFHQPVSIDDYEDYKKEKKLMNEHAKKGKIYYKMHTPRIVPTKIDKK